MLRFTWLGMVVLQEQGGNVGVHGEAAGSFVVVPLDVDACKFSARRVSGDCVMLL